MEYTDEFNAFWKAYPKRFNQNLGVSVKRKKPPAFKVWQKLPQEIRDKCLRIVHFIYKAEGGMPRDAVTWLNQEGWDEIEEKDYVKEAIAERERIAKKREEARKDVGKYFHEQTKENLAKMRINQKYQMYWWLIDEVLSGQ